MPNKLVLYIELQMVMEVSPDAVQPSGDNSPELESLMPSDTVLEQRIEQVEKNVAWIREALSHML